jgi:orotate phosphoribosyltransferase
MAEDLSEAFLPIEDANGRSRSSLTGPHSTDGNRYAMDETRQRLKELFLTRAVSFGSFTLASGKTSSYYINSKKVLFSSEAVALLGDLLYSATSDLDIQAIGGLEVGAIPMATAACLSYHRAGRAIEGFFVRKQAKGHGSQSRVEGLVKSGDAVAVIDDVLTTGGSVLQAIDELEKIGAKVLRVVCIVDRLQGAREALAKYDYRPLFTIRDLGIQGE